MIQFFKRLIASNDRNVFVSLDNLPAHCSHVVRDWVHNNADAIELFYLPSYLLHLNRRSTAELGELAVGLVDSFSREIEHRSGREVLDTIGFDTAEPYQTELDIDPNGLDRQN